MTDLREFRRWPLERGQRLPEYVLGKADIDKLPIGTFLIESEVATRVDPHKVMRVVRPNEPKNYRAGLRTPGDRLVYICWASGRALKQLYSFTGTGDMRLAFIVQPGEPGYDILDAFKILCDTKRACAEKPPEVKSTLLIRAIQLQLASLT